MKPLLALILAACASLAHAADRHIIHMEPPSWWVGMQAREVQLMVHGRQIADLAPSLQYPEVRISQVRRVANPNYLFVTLAIGDKAAAGMMDLQFGAGPDALHYAFPLQARSPGSRLRKGFD